MQIKVGTYNICHCADFNEPIQDDGRSFVSPERTAKFLRNLNLDIVGLNEVFCSGPGEQYSKQTDKIARFLNYSYYAFAMGAKTDWGESIDAIGNSVISKYPIKSIETEPVLSPALNERKPEENDWYENRVILKCVFDVCGKEVVFISTHFGLNKSERLRMVKSLVEIIDNETRPIVLMGDFNTSPDSLDLIPIYERLVNVAEIKGKKYEKTFESSNPTVTLDYIFVSKEINILDFNVVDKVLSDHLPITAILEIE